MRATWVLLLIAFSPIISLLPIAALFALAIGVGAALGTALARAEGVPSLPAVSTLLLALMVAIGPVVAGMIEVGLRSAPFPLPADVRTVTWDKDPMGGQTLRLESTLSVPDLNDRLVEAAKNSGWVCRYCQYQPSTRTGHAAFDSRDRRLGGPGGTLRFEIWPGDMALYDSAPSDLTQAVIWNRRRSWSVEWAVLAIAVFLLLAIISVAERN